MAGLEFTLWTVAAFDSWKSLVDRINATLPGFFCFLVGLFKTGYLEPGLMLIYLCSWFCLGILIT